MSRLVFIFRLVGVLFLLAVTGVVARADGVAVALNPAVIAAETRVALGFAVQGTRYSEGFAGASDQESGVLPGFSAEASRLGSLLGMPGIYSGVVYDFAGGPLAYNGFIQGGAAPGLSPYDATDHARFNSIEVRLGEALALSTAVDVIPFVTAGYQNWYRDVGGAGGYGEFYRAAIAGVGARFDVAVSDRLVISATAEGLRWLAGVLRRPPWGLLRDLGPAVRRRFISVPIGG